MKSMIRDKDIYIMVIVILNIEDIMVMNMYTANNIDFKYILKDFLELWKIQLNQQIQ